MNKVGGGGGGSDDDDDDNDGFSARKVGPLINMLTMDYMNETVSRCLPLRQYLLL